MSDLDYDAPMPLFGRSDPSGGDGYAPGAWDEVRAAFMEGHISEPAYNTLRAALDLAQRAEAAWPCDDYEAPLTCFTTPRPKTLICEGCQAAFPSGSKSAALYANAEADRAAVERVRALADDLDKRAGSMGEKARAAGMNFIYQNHADRLRNALDPKADQ